MRMDEITVEGFKVIVEKDKDGFVATVQELPGFVARSKDRDEIKHEVRRRMHAYIRELVLKPASVRNETKPKDDPAAKIRK
jgi:predicted RNase H-like HicB family nuclease